MKRKTLEELQLYPRIRPAKKNKSCQFSNPRVSKVQPHTLSSAPLIATLLLEELLLKAETFFEQIDTQLHIQSLAATHTMLAAHLNQLSSPFHCNSTTDALAFSQPEPIRTQADLLCTAATLQTRKQMQIVQTWAGWEQRVSKQTISSKCLIKLPKEQANERKRSLQALGVVREEADRIEEQMREKLLRQTTQVKQVVKLGKTDTFEKSSTLPSVEEWAHDYDGSFLPVRRSARVALEKIHILTTTCKVSARETVQQARFVLNPAKKENLQPRLSRKITSQSIRELVKVCNQEAVERGWECGVQSLLKGRGVRMRELKQTE